MSNWCQCWDSIISRRNLPLCVHNHFYVMGGKAYILHMTVKRYVADSHQYYPVMWPIFIFCKDIFCKRSFDAETPQYKRRHHSSAFFLFSTNSVTTTTTTTKPTARQHKHISLICNSKLPLPGTQTDVHTMSTLDNTQTNKRDAEKPSPTKKQMKPPKYSNPSPASAPTPPQEHHTTPTFGPCPAL
jgi:hypothetical protein